jgi:transcription initiation factor TFIIIB Brf1 subunit/transcription initiation factor TFIIB
MKGELICSSCGYFSGIKIDNGAEWRYYGADDNKQGDPTRCGMPINPLLKESSYGCKVICNNSTYYYIHK